jgi:capsular polysaccharide biosynthesis protein
MKFKEISGAISNAEKSYARYVDQREDARVAALSDPKMTNVRVVHYAAVPEIPVLSRMFLIQIGAFVGLLMGFGLAFVLEFFDHSLGNKEDVEYYLDLPLIASIPEINDAGRGTNAAHLEPRSPS